MTLAPSSKGAQGDAARAQRDASAATEVLGAVEARRARTRRLRWTLGAVGLVVSIVVVMTLLRRHDASIRAEARRVSMERASLGTFVALREASEVIGDARARVGPDADLARIDRLLQGIRAAEFGDVNALERVTATQGRAEVGTDPLAEGLERAALGDLDGLMEAVSRLESTPPAPNGGGNPWASALRSWPGLALSMWRGAPSGKGSSDAPGVAPAPSGGLDMDAAIAVQRLQIFLAYRGGDRRGALKMLEDLRSRAATHVGLAADEALLRAAGRGQLGAVASLSEQLLGRGGSLSPADRGRASLARSVVQLYSGEREAAARTVKVAWPSLPAWDRLSRELAIEVAVDSGDRALVRRLLDAAGLSTEDVEVYRAWSEYEEGAPASALRRLSTLDQQRPRVAYLQALCLVAQERYDEAGPWLARAEFLFPGRIELEVARARLAIHGDDPRASMRALEGLAREEPYAPRAWTGLGEARLEVFEREGRVDLRLALGAQEALERAVEVEPVPATAHRRLASLWRARMGMREDAAPRALRHARAAAEVNPRVPRNREELALLLFDLSLVDEARGIMDALLAEGHVTAPLLLARAQVAAEELSSQVRPDPETLARGRAWVDRATSLGASSAASMIARISLALSHDEAGVRSLIARETWPLSARELALRGRATAAVVDRDAGVLMLRRGLRAFTEAEVGPLFLEWARIELRGERFARAGSHAALAYRRLKEENAPPREQLEAAALATMGMVRSQRARAAFRMTAELTRRFEMVARAWEIHALAAFHAGASEDAVSAIDRAVALRPEVASAHDLRARILARRGDQVGARQAARQAMELARGQRGYLDYKERWEKMR